MPNRVVPYLLANVPRWSGPKSEQRLVLALLFCVILEAFSVVDWGLAWAAGGFLTLIAAIVSTVSNLVGIHCIWNRKMDALLVYAIILGGLSVMFTTNFVLILMASFMNDSTYLASSAEVIQDPYNIFKGELARLVGTAGEPLYILAVTTGITVAYTITLFFLVLSACRLHKFEHAFTFRNEPWEFHATPTLTALPSQRNEPNTVRLSSPSAMSIPTARLFNIQSVAKSEYDDETIEIYQNWESLNITGTDQQGSPAILHTTTTTVDK